MACNYFIFIKIVQNKITLKVFLIINSRLQFSVLCSSYVRKKSRIYYNNNVQSSYEQINRRKQGGKIHHPTFTNTNTCNTAGSSISSFFILALVFLKVLFKTINRSILSMSIYYILDEQTLDLGDVSRVNVNNNLLLIKSQLKL